jgi:gas vesicle protein GvpA/GvpJ/GvpM family
MTPPDQSSGSFPLPQAAFGRADLRPSGGGPANLADILERVLDKGIVIAGDIQVNLLDIELLTIKIRLLVCSVDRAQEMGINWWETDSRLSGDARQLESENRDLRARIERLERALGPGDDS